jgi:hypothetical protein
MSRVACVLVIRPDGIVRQGLLCLSSRIAAGCLWLSMAKGSKFIQTHKITVGVRMRVVRIISGLTGACGASSSDIANAFRIPKVVLGATMVFKSLKVKSQMEYAW